MIKNRTPQKTNTMKRIKTNLLALYHNVLCYVKSALDNTRGSLKVEKAEICRIKFKKGSWDIDSEVWVNEYRLKFNIQLPVKICY